MTLIKRDQWSNQLEAVSIQEAVKHTVDQATLGYEGSVDKALSMAKVQTEILGRLIETLARKQKLSEKDIIIVLGEPSLMLGVEQ